MLDLYPRFAKQIAHFPANTICVALSGGVDSVVLLHLLKRHCQQHSLTLSAIHVHHGLNPDADDWQAFCQQLCQKWHIPFQAAKVSVLPEKLGIEAAARAARYRVFAQQNAPVIALAHHQNDQHETFLLAALRGGGVRALSAMPTVRKHYFSGSLKTFWRPLLSFSRQEIEAYAQTQQLTWIHDNSNDNSQDYLRNFLRQHTLPELAARVPHLAAQLNASIAAVQNDLILLDELAEYDYQTLTQNTQQWQQSAWQKLSFARQQQQLAYFCQRHQLGTPTRASIENFAHILRQAKTAQWQLPAGLALLYQNVLLPLPHDFQQHWFWLEKPHSGSLKDLFTSLHLNHQLPESLSHQHVLMRCAQKNDELLIQNQQHQKAFKILQQNGVPALLRPLWPVLVNEQNQLIAIFNLRVSAVYANKLMLPEIAFLNNYRVCRKADLL